jgi:hypothetical protein
MILLARCNRRATVIVALRGLLVLGAIGAIGRPSWAALLIVGALAVALFALEKGWKKQSDVHHPEGCATLFANPNDAKSNTRRH